MSNILFKMSGSIAAYKSCAVVSSLVKSGHQVQIVITKDVLNFVGLSTLEGLSGREVLSETHHPGDMMAHIHLNTWADLTLLCPASANTLAKIATGIADNLVTTLALAKDPSKPYLIFPAMNPKMWSASVTQANVKKLKSFGYEIHTGDQGPVACGDYGVGRMMEPEDILRHIDQKLLNTKSQQNHPLRKVLVTAGGTSESIDAVRVFSNTSTGKTGAALACAFASDYDVTLLASSAAKDQLIKLSDGGAVSKNINIVLFDSFESLKDQLQAYLQKEDYWAVIHAAAVSDYKPESIIQDSKTYALPLSTKLSTSDSMQIQFSKNPKLIDSIKAWSKNKSVLLVGFKLLEDKSEATVTKNLNKIFKSSDYVVLNFVSEIQDAKHRYLIYKSVNEVVDAGETKEQLAEGLYKLVTHASHNDEKVENLEI